MQLGLQKIINIKIHDVGKYLNAEDLVRISEANQKILNRRFSDV